MNLINENQLKSYVKFLVHEETKGILEEINKLIKDFSNLQVSFIRLQEEIIVKKQNDK